MPVDVFNLAMDVAAGVCPGSDEGGGATRGVGDAVGVESDVESPVGPDGVQRFGGIPGRNWEEWSSWLHAVGVSHVERATINQLAFTGSWGATGCDNTTVEVRALATLTRFRFATVGLASGGMDFPRVRIYVGDPLTAGEQQLLFRLVKDVVDVVFASAPVAGREVVGGLVRKAFIRVVWSWLLELGSRELAAVVW